MYDKPAIPRVAALTPCTDDMLTVSVLLVPALSFTTAGLVSSRFCREVSRAGFAADRSREDLQDLGRLLVACAGIFRTMLAR